jgi:hypothetical protein
MIPEIFDIENNHVVINPTCLLIPELKAVTEEYKDPIPALSFLHFRFSPKGAYCNTPEEDKDEILLMDFPGEYTLEDPVMIAAINKLQFLTLSPTYRYYLDNKELLEKIGKFGRVTAITAGRDGNINALLSQVRSTGKTISEFKQLEKIVQEEIDQHKSRVRGEKRKAYDQ